MSDADAFRPRTVPLARWPPQVVVGVQSSATPDTDVWQFGLLIREFGCRGELPFLALCNPFATTTTSSSSSSPPPSSAPASSSPWAPLQAFHLALTRSVPPQPQPAALKATPAGWAPAHPVSLVRPHLYVPWPTFVVGSDAADRSEDAAAAVVAAIGAYSSNELNARWGVYTALPPAAPAAASASAVILPRLVRLCLRWQTRERPTMAHVVTLFQQMLYD